MAASTTIPGLGSHLAPWQTGHAVGALRSMLRGAAFGFALLVSALDYVRVQGFCRRTEPRRRRALWLQRWCRIFARIIGLRVDHRGALPSSGMVVSNHLSYLDILAYSALVPCVFVAKREVATWPVFGIFAQMAGTIFVDRTRRMKVAEANGEISAALRAGIVVVLFAEGTSSEGRIVLPFRSSLLEPAALCHGDLRPAAIRYQLDDGSVPREVCYWGEMTLLPHLLNLFSKREIRSHIVMGATDATLSTVSRKDAARLLHQRVSQLYHPAFPQWSDCEAVLKP